MQPSFDWLSILLIVGAGHGISLGITFLMMKRGNSHANRLLAANLVLVAVIIGLQALVASRYIFNIPHLADAATPLIFLIGPFLLFHATAFLDPKYRLSGKEVFHLIPALLVFFYLLPFYFLPGDEKIAQLTARFDNLGKPASLIFGLSMAQIFCYISMIGYRLSRRQKAAFLCAKNSYKWLLFDLSVLLASWVAAVAFYMFRPSVDSQNIVWLIVSLDIFVIGYLALHQPELSDAASALSNGRKTIGTKYRKSSLTPAMAEQYLGRLQRFMSEQKPFLEGTVTLQSLSRELSISGHHLSQIINERLERNFFEYMNEHRVAEAKAIISKPDGRHLNLAEIAFQVGFNSVSSFNLAFKKFAGVTPSQYRDGLAANRPD